MRIGSKLPLASLPEIQAGPSEDQTEIRGDERSGASERTALEKPAGEQNEKASTAATGKGGKGSKKPEKEERIGEEEDIPEATPKKMPAACGKKKWAAKQRLVSYSSQDSESDTASIKSSRKRTAVTMMGGVMIDHISGGGNQEKGNE